MLVVVVVVVVVVAAVVVVVVATNWTRLDFLWVRRVPPSVLVLIGIPARTSLFLR
jgi:hypothetical protein